VINGTETETKAETAETLVKALRRLAGAAGREIAWDVCSIREDHGWAWDGVVWTTVRYPFGFHANLPAGLLRDILTQLTEPMVEVGESSVTMKEAGRKFKIQRTMTEVTRWVHPKPDVAVPLSGAWLRTLNPAIPLRMGHRQFVGVWAGPEGYVATDGALLGHLKVLGPAVPTIVPRQILDALPAIPARLSADPNTIWIESEDGTTWQCPPLQGEFHLWQQAFPKVDREIGVLVPDFKSAVCAVSIVCRFCSITTEKEGLIRAMGIGEDVIRGADAEAKFEIQKQEGLPIKITVDSRKLLEILEVCHGKALSLSTNATQTHLLVRPLDQTPEIRFVMAHIRGTASY
jgi:hypothetical protein